MAKVNKPKMGFISKIGTAADIFFTGYSLVSLFTSPNEANVEEAPTKDEIKEWNEESRKESLTQSREIGDNSFNHYEVIKADPDVRDMDKGSVLKSEGSNNVESNTVAKALKSMLSDLDLDNDDNDENTDYLYDLYFVTGMRERALKRWPTIRNYHNLYSFSAMLKETKQESTYEEMVVLCFYFRMV